jgi:DNA helicase II / ATP-dependent DNA helicase PcrA
MDSLSPEDLAAVEDQERIVALVQAAIVEARTHKEGVRNLAERVEQLQEAAATASNVDLPPILTQLHVLRRQAERLAATQIPSPEVPYFAHMQLEVRGKCRDVLLGYQTFIDAANAVTIVDWRTAPIAQVFFNYQEGEEYEHEVEGRSSSGVVRRRNVVTFEHGRVVALTTPRAVLRRTAEGWERTGASDQPHLVAGAGDEGSRLFGTGEAGQKVPAVTALLDPDQFAALQADSDQPLLILGGAGCGKTTVALHRLASLNWRDPQRFVASDMGVIVPERGLESLTRIILREIGMADVRVSTFDDWMRRHGTRLLRGLPRTLCPSTPLKVSRFKRHPALMSVLPDLIEELAAELGKDLDRVLRSDGLVSAVLTAESARGQTLRARLNRAERKLCKGQPATWQRQVHSLFRRERRHLSRMVGDRQRLLLDRALLARAVLASRGDLTQSMADEVVAHTAAQLARRTEEEWSHVDADRLETLDKRAIDDGTPMEIAGTIDVEDYALLFALHRLKTGSMNTDKGRFPRLSHLVVDEAQDLATVELSVLGASLDDDGSVTVAGDRAQQIDPSVVFAGWEGVLDALGVAWSSPVQLQTSYRCPRPIADFGRKVLGPLAPAAMPHIPREGAEVLVVHRPSEGHAAVYLVEVLSNLRTQEPQANVAVIARTPESASRIHTALSRAMSANLVLDGDFHFKPGVDVTDVSQVKGLEFDYVVIPDASSNHYPDRDACRRALHVAVTRAYYQLCIVTTGRPSPLV